MTGSVPLIVLKDFSLRRGARAAIENFSLALQPGETIVLLGEQGSGKEAVVKALAGSVERGEEFGGTVSLRGSDFEPASRLRTAPLRTAYLPSPSAAPLSPHFSVIGQLSRVIAGRLGAPLASGRAEFASALERLKGAPPLETFERRAGALDPEMLAWALFAAAFAQTPELLIAYDPLSGLGPTQARALIDILRREQERIDFALLYATMNTEAALWLGCKLSVLRQGRVVEEGPVAKLAGEQAHAYTRTLFRAAPKLAARASTRATNRSEPVLQIHGLELGGKTKPARSARDIVTFELRRGASLALVGERESGRHALMRAALGLDRVAAGRVILDAVDIGVLSQSMLLRLRRRIAFISGSDDVLDPRMTIWDTVSEPLRAHLSLPRAVVAQYRDAALKRVGLAALAGRQTVETLSAFDKRRLQVARAIVGAPLLAVVDEPLRGLDAFAQSVMSELLREFRDSEGPAMLLITADFTVAQGLAEDVMVFKDGRIVERGGLAEVLAHPKEAHTRLLIEAVRAKPATETGP